MIFRNPAAEFVYIRTYARWIDSLGRRETWEETVDRYVNFLKEERGDKIPPKVLKKIREKILNFEVMPSMRALWAAGPAARQDNLTIYNCSALEVNSIESFAEALYILMCGTGEGYSVRQSSVDKLPDVPAFNQSTPPSKHVVEDSRKGWAESIRILLTALYSGTDVDFDYSLLRPKGAKLIVMGGRSSGPAPLITTHSFIRETLHKASGRKLTTLECSDIMNQIAESVVVGGMRRSSQISLSDLQDEAMRHAKDWPFPPRRYMSNNSAIYETKPSAVEFLKEWSALAASGTGERGIFNLESLRKNAPNRRNSSLISLTNPCVTGDTLLLTPNGYVRIDSVVDVPIKIWNGWEFSEVIPTITGINQPLIKLTFSNGTNLSCTPYHRFELAKGYTGESESVIAKDLRIGDKLIKHTLPILSEGESLSDPYTNGFVAAEGMEHSRQLWVYFPKSCVLPRLTGVKKVTKQDKYSRWSVVLDNIPRSKKFVPIDFNLHSKLEWLAGLLDGDGCELKEGGCQLVSVDKEFLLDVQKLLATLGEMSKVVLASAAAEKLMPNHTGSYSLYQCKETHRICLGAATMQRLKTLGLRCERLKFDKTPNRDASQFVTVTSMQDAGEAKEVFCFKEPKRGLALFNGVVTGQCGEIALRNQGLCNLSEVVVRAEDDLDSLLDKVETATWIGAIQSTFTDFSYVGPQWKANAEEERLLGVSLTGQMDNPEMMKPEYLKALKSKAIKVARHASIKLGINMPAAITCTKPSGTVSQLVDSASGIHARFAPYYIRRYRISATDPLCKLLRDQGIKLTPENGQENLPTEEVTTYVVSFPSKSPQGAITKDQLTALEQLEIYKKTQTNWCEHNVSMTVYVKDHEWFDVGNWVYNNWDFITGLSFLPFDGGKYKQAPYEEITKDQYEKMIAKFPRIDYSQLSRYETSDLTEGAKSYSCVGDKCELV